MDKSINQIEMEASELNRRIKAEFKKWLKLREEKSPETYEEWKVFEEKLEAIRLEVKRLYSIDKEFKYINHKNVLRLLRMNLMVKFEKYHIFGIYIDEFKL